MTHAELLTALRAAIYLTLLEVTFITIVMQKYTGIRLMSGGFFETSVLLRLILKSLVFTLAVSFLMVLVIS